MSPCPTSWCLPTGKILGAGTRGCSTGFLLARFNSNGTPDLSFGGEGFKVEPDLDQADDPRAIEAIEERGDGKFVVAGGGRAPVTGFDAFEFGRYLPNGELDPELRANGLTTVAINEFGGAALRWTKPRREDRRGRRCGDAGDAGELPPSFA